MSMDAVSASELIQFIDLFEWFSPLQLVDISSVYRSASDQEKMEEIKHKLSGRYDVRPGTNEYFFPLEPAKCKKYGMMAPKREGVTLIRLR